jgi:hypothetical protein
MKTKLEISYTWQTSAAAKKKIAAKYNINSLDLHPANPILLYQICKYIYNDLSYNVGKDVLRSLYHCEDYKQYIIPLFKELGIDYDSLYYSYTDGIAKEINSSLIDKELAYNIYKNWCQYTSMDNKEIIKFSKKILKNNPQNHQLEYLNKQVFRNAELHIPNIELAKDFIFNKMNCDLQEKNNNIIGLEFACFAWQNVQLYKQELNRFYLYGSTSIQNIHSDLRQYLFEKSKGYYEIDLTSAHASIAAKIFDLKHLQKELSKNDYRQDIANLLGCSKKCIKLAINSLLYGAGSNQLRIMFIEDDVERQFAQNCFDNNYHGNELYLSFIQENLADDKLEQFLSFEFVQEIKSALSKNLDLLEDAFGNRYKESAYAKDGKKGHSRKLSAVFGSYEQLLLDPLYYDDRCEVILNQYDGVTLYVKPGYSIDDILDDVNKYIEELGFQTKVSVK